MFEPSFLGKRRVKINPNECSHEAILPLLIPEHLDSVSKKQRQRTRPNPYRVVLETDHSPLSHLEVWRKLWLRTRTLGTLILESIDMWTDLRAELNLGIDIPRPTLVELILDHYDPSLEHQVLRLNLGLTREASPNPAKMVMTRTMAMTSLTLAQVHLPSGDSRPTN
jgi:hypothetical protein